MVRRMEPNRPMMEEMMLPMDSTMPAMLADESESEGDGKGSVESLSVWTDVSVSE